MTKYDAICLSGGGIKGIAQLGALQRHWELGDINYKDVKAYSGTSIGSVIALLLSVGYNPTEIFQKVCDITNFFDTKNNQSVFVKMGLLGIESFTSYVSKLVLDKCRLEKIPTMKELYEITKKELFITGSNTTKMTGEVFSHITRPNLSCIDAVNYSCNLPLIFSRKVHKGDTFIDGGFSDNLPILALKNKDEKRKILAITISGIDIESSDTSFMSYITRSMLFMIHTIQCMKTKEALLDREIEVHIENISINSEILISVNLAHEQKMEMFVNGYNYSEILQVDQYLFIKR